MPVPFHALNSLAKKVERELAAQKPEFLPLIASLKKEYTNAASLHAAFCFFLIGNAQDAITKIKTERKIETPNARTELALALTKGQKVLPQDPDYFYASGIKKVRDAYYIVPKDLEKNGDYDTARRQLPAAARKILEEAETHAFRTRRASSEIGISTAALQYIAAQLMEEGPSKDARFNALSLSKNKTAHQKKLQDSAYALHKVCEKMQIDPVSLNIVIRDGGAPFKRGRNANNALSTPRLANITTSAMPSNDFSTSREELRDQLKSLVVGKKITREEALTYFNLTAIKDGRVITTREMAEKNGVPVKEIEDISAKVMKALGDTQSSTNLAASNGDLHQSRAVRP